MQQPRPDRGGSFASSQADMPDVASEPHVLVVEDDGETRRLLVRLLRENGLRTTGVADGQEMWESLKTAPPDLLLLDLMLPKKSGLELLRELRREQRWSGLPVVIVTARGEVGDRTRGLELGADDYIPKPFDRRELLARVAAVLRRTTGQGHTPRRSAVRFSGWSLDTGRRSLTSPEGATVDLSGAEYDLLTVFLDNSKRTCRVSASSNLPGTGFLSPRPTEASMCKSAACARSWRAKGKAVVLSKPYEASAMCLWRTSTNERLNAPGLASGFDWSHRRVVVGQLDGLSRGKPLDSSA